MRIASADLFQVLASAPFNNSTQRGQVASFRPKAILQSALCFVPFAMS